MGRIASPAFCLDLVALKNPGIALDCLHQGAGFTLLGGAALAEAAATQPGPQFLDRHGRSGKIMGGMEVGVHRQIGFDPFEPRDHAREGAYMLAESRNGCPR